MRDHEPLLTLNSEKVADPIIKSDDADEEFTAKDAADVHLCLGILAFENREVLILRFLEDMSYVQIAAVVDRDLGTIKSRIHYAKRALRREIEKLRCQKSIPTL